MLHSPAEVAQARRRRLIIIAAITIAVEGCLALLAHFGPALESLIWPVYWIVLLIAVATVWHSFRRNAHHERRHQDRRRR